MIKRKITKTKKAQLTMFVIIAILVVVLFSTGLFLYRQLTQRQFNKDSRVIRDFYVSCLTNKLDDALGLVAKQSGYYKIEQTILASFLNENTAFYFLNNNIIIPSIETVENEIFNYMIENDDCIQQIKQKSGFDNYSINSECDKLQLLINNSIMNCKLYINDEKNHKMFKLYISSIGLLRQLNASKEIIKNYAEKPGYICIECMDEIALKHKVNITIIPITTQIADVTKDVAWFFVKPLSEQDVKLNKSLTLRFAVTLE
jgi:hypothetical protein